MSNMPSPLDTELEQKTAEYIQYVKTYIGDSKKERGWMKHDPRLNYYVALENENVILEFKL